LHFQVEVLSLILFYFFSFSFFLHSILGTIHVIFFRHVNHNETKSSTTSRTDDGLDKQPTDLQID